MIEFLNAIASISPETWLKQVYLGLVNGAVLVLLALGLTIIFGMMGIVNFAHGAFYMIGAYLGWFVLRCTGSFWVALAVAPILGGVFGIGVERSVLRRVYNRPESVFLGILITFGISFLAPDLVRLIFGKTGLPYAMPSALKGTAFMIGHTQFSLYRLFLIGLAFLLTVLLWLVLQKTNLGMIIRAGISNATMVEVLGIDIRRVWTGTFGLGIALASAAGVLVGPVFAVQPTMGDVIVIQCFIVVIIGGMGSFWGAVLSALIVGQVLTLFPLLPYAERLADVVIYLLMAFVLLVRPRGLLGQEGVAEQ
jgi:branched-chain amino acid transport system permease protein